MPEYKEIEVPVGAFIGWGKLGQTVTIQVLDFDPTGGRTYNGDPCPQLTGTLVEDADSYQEKGTKLVKHKAGELVTVTAGQANLRKGLLLCDPKRNDLVRMTYADTYKTAQGDGKVIKVEHAPASEASVTEDDI